MVEQIKIAVVKDDDGVVVMSLVLSDDNGINRQFTNELVNNEIIKFLDTYKSWHILYDDTKLLDRTFRNAWKVNNNMIDVDMDKARNIWRDKLRIERGPLLEALDVEFLKSLEDNNKTKQDEIKSKKQALRDITIDPRIDMATTPDELKLIRW